MSPSAQLALRIFGVVLAGVIFGVPFEYCMEGVGYGFPFAWFHPDHNDWGAYVISSNENSSNVIDFPNIALSLLVWAIAYLGVRHSLKRMQQPNVVGANVEQ
jgi:hypothetical protein